MQDENNLHPFLEFGITTSIKEQANKLKAITKSKEKFEDELFCPDEDSILDANITSKENSKKNQKKEKELNNDKIRSTMLSSLVKKVSKSMSITKDIRLFSSNYSLKRLSDLYDIKNLNIFKKNPQESDVIQGDLGDCYFLSALAALAENPVRIKKLFPQLTLNNNGVFEVNIFLHGEPVTILLDDFFVVKDVENDNKNEESNEDQDQDVEKEKELAFAKINPDSNSIWPILLEKTWAKLNGNYEKIISGNVSEVYELLSPAPFQTLYHNFHHDCLFDSVKRALERNNIVSCDITAPSNSIDYNKLKDMGLITNHAYNVIEAAEVSDIRGNKIPLLRIKNNWGTNEWEGDWSDKSNKWTEEYKQLLNWEDKEDGIFWISLDDYLQFYTTTHICHEQDSFNYVSERIPFDKHKPVNFFKVVVSSISSGYITVNQKNTRIYNNSKGEENYENHYGSMFVYKYDKQDQNKLIAVGNDSGKKSRMFVEVENFEKGEYFVALNFPFKTDYPVNDFTDFDETEEKKDVNPTLHEAFSVRVGVYSSSKGIAIDDIPEDSNDVKEFFIDYVASDAQLSTNKYHFEEEGENESFRVPVFDQKSAYGYIYYENNSDGFINELLTFSELKNVSIIPLLRRGNISSLKGMVENSEEPEEVVELELLGKKIDIESKFEIIIDVDKRKGVSSKTPFAVSVSIAPKCSGVILLEKNQVGASVDFDSSIVITYPIHEIIKNHCRFDVSKTKVKYNNKSVDIYETIIEHNSGVLIRYANKTKNLVFGSLIKLGDLENIKIALNSNELKKEAFLESKTLREEGEDELMDDESVLLGEDTALDCNNFNLEIKDPKTEVALVLEPGEIKFVELKATDLFESYSYNLESTFMINLSNISK
jgi:hypothetical protein